MEGITGYVYRNAHHRYFRGIAQYYTPFLVPNQNRRLTSRETADISPEHNQGVPVVPQIMSCKADEFIWAARKVRALGYREVNLNLGCPSATVVTGNGAPDSWHFRRSWTPFFPGSVRPWNRWIWSCRSRPGPAGNTGRNSRGFWKSSAAIP